MGEWGRQGTRCTHAYLRSHEIEELAELGDPRVRHCGVDEHGLGVALPQPHRGGLGHLKVPRPVRCEGPREVRLVVEL